MTDDQDKKDDEELELEPAGQSLGYISSDQARVLALQHARDNRGFYGRPCRRGAPGHRRSRGWRALRFRCFSFTSDYATDATRSRRRRGTDALRPACPVGSPRGYACAHSRACSKPGADACTHSCTDADSDTRPGVGINPMSATPTARIVDE